MLSALAYSIENQTQFQGQSYKKVMGQTPYLIFCFDALIEFGTLPIYFYK